MLRKKWGHELASIRWEGVMPMLTVIGDLATVVGFLVSALGFIVLIALKTLPRFLPRLLGVEQL